MALLALAGGLAFIAIRMGPAPSPTPARPPRSSPSPPPVPGLDSRQHDLPRPGPGARVALVIDDVGQNLGLARPFLDSPFPLTLAFLPALPHTREIAEEAYRRGKAVFLHLPMEPRGWPEENPGQGALFTGRPQEETLRTLEEDLAAVPHASGLNNHMGSRATEDPATMRLVMGLLRDRGLVFLDSLTSPDSQGFALAREVGVPAAERDVFLDNERDPSAIDRRIDELLALAVRRGWAVGIAHPYPETAEALPRLRAKAREKGVELVTLEEILGHAGPGNRNVLR